MKDGLMGNDKLYRQITVTRSRDFGGAVGVISIALTEENVDAKSSLVAAQILAEQADKMMAHYIETNQARLSSRMGEIKSDPQPIIPAVDTQIFPATGISVTMDNGERRYRVKGGKFSEHGVSFYPEHMEANGIKPENIPDQGHAFKQKTKMYVEFEGGKAKRVVKLEKA